MLPAEVYSAISQAISQTTGEAFILKHSRPVSGGCINQAQILEGQHTRFFIKLNTAACVDMFAAEADGLREILRAGAVRAPRPICWGAIAEHAYLVLEHIEMGAGSSQAAAQFGEQLAAMHRYTHAQYGWQRDNTLGSTPQSNIPSRDWISFWQEQRLGYQLDLAQRRGVHTDLLELGARLRTDVGKFFTGYTPTASLLHGDLWSGNYGFDSQDRGVIFDPAVYYGDRETDLAMTELFGGFPAAFYAAYHAAYPLDPGYARRKDLYNLYHVLNHWNLFGGGYQGQALRMLEALLGDI